MKTRPCDGAAGACCASAMPLASKPKRPPVEIGRRPGIFLNDGDGPRPTIVDLEVDGGFLLPSVRRTFEEAVENFDAGGRRPLAVIGRPFAAPVCVEPFLRRGSAAKSSKEPRE